MDYTNLINKTIFDFTNDPKIIWEEFGINETPEEYRKGLAIRTRIMDFIALAKIMNDETLDKEIDKQFEKELSIWGLE
ncbi:MAG: hypothetical protein ACPGSD_07800 [Flavobacteriales bacterium]